MNRRREACAAYSHETDCNSHGSITLTAVRSNMNINHKPGSHQDVHKSFSLLKVSQTYKMCAGYSFQLCKIIQLQGPNLGPMDVLS